MPKPKLIPFPFDYTDPLLQPWMVDGDFEEEEEDAVDDGIDDEYAIYGDEADEIEEGNLYGDEDDFELDDDDMYDDEEEGEDFEGYSLLDTDEFEDDDDFYSADDDDEEEDDFDDIDEDDF